MITEVSTIIESVEELNEVPDLSILIDNRWDLWRVSDGRATLHGGRRSALNVPWEIAVKGQTGIFPFQLLWAPQTSTI